MYNLGRVCVKLAGRDAGKYCVVVDELQDGRVLIEGQTRRRSVNPDHLEPTKQVVDVAKEASFEDVQKALESIDIKVNKPMTQKEIVKSKQS